MQSNVLILTYWSFDDSLIQAYTLPYIRIIRKSLSVESRIILLTLERVDPEGIVGQEIRIRNSLLSEGVEWMYGQYHPFGFRALGVWTGLLARLATCIYQRRINMIHCWGTPAGSVGWLLSTLTGRNLTIDSYEPHAEAMVENGTWKRSSVAFRLLFALEKLQTRRAKFLIAADSAMRTYALEKLGVELKHMLAKPACVDLDLFSEEKVKNPTRLRELGLSDKIVCVYAGKFGGIYLEKEIFDFLAEAHARWGERFRVLLLTSHSSHEIERYCQASGLDFSIVIARFVPHSEVAYYMGLGDFAVTPVKPVPTKRYCTPIKDGEYWALGLPVVITADISQDSDIIRENEIGAVLDHLEREGYRNALEKIEKLLAGPRKELAQKIRGIAIRYRSYDIADKVYQEVYGG